MNKRIVICLDGTGNQPRSGRTNVRRLYDMLVEDESQTSYYDPGVGTLGAENASNRFNKWTTRVGGLVFGHGVKENVGQAYQFLAESWEPGDRIFIFGFSRGAYTARALTGLLRTIGLLRPQLSGNLTEYALEFYTDKGMGEEDFENLDAAARENLRKMSQDWWQDREEWQASFSHPDWPSRWEWDQVHFLGLWDTVKFVGTLNKRAQLEEAKWPFTRNPVNVAHTRHAISIDERRKKYEEYRLQPALVADERRDAREVWFAGVHSDVGGTFFDDKRLADVSLKWMVDEATSSQLALDRRTGERFDDADLRTLGIDAEKYSELLSLDPKKYPGVRAPQLGEPLDPTYFSGALHPAGAVWWFTGPGWRDRPILRGDEVHQSVYERAARLGDAYRPAIPDGAKRTD